MRKRKKYCFFTMASVTALSLNLDPYFFEACLAISKLGIHSPNCLLPDAVSIGKLSLSWDDVSDATRLTKNYSNAYSDFYGSRTPCVYKTGPAWRVRESPEAQGIVREARPVYGHPIGRTWRAIGKRIYEEGLDSKGVKWAVINPLASANEGEASPFCPLIISVGVKPRSIAYDDAVAAAEGVKKVLAEEGFPEIEVAFVELVLTRSVAGTRLLSFEPLFDEVPEFRKPFTPALGVPIAPLRFPYCEGTGGLYLRLGKDDSRVVMLTCAHVARPLPVYANTDTTRKQNSQAREEMVSLGNLAFSNALKAMMCEIGNQLSSIDAWNGVLTRLGEFVEGENAKVTERRNEHLGFVEKAKKRIAEVNKLHDEVTKRRTILEQRVIGFVLHCEEIGVSVDPYGFTEDWALIELYEKVIDWPLLKGNQVWVSGELSVPDFGNIMFPQPEDRVGYRYPEDGLLKVFGVVQDAEMRNPQHLDVHGQKCLLVVKNGATTGSTAGRVNGLESFKRVYTEYGIKHTSIEIAVLNYDKRHSKFSRAGDSGSIVLARDGRIVGILTGGAGPTGETDITYLAPYWWLEKQIQKKFPGAFLYQVAA